MIPQKISSIHINKTNSLPPTANNIVSNVVPNKEKSLVTDFQQMELTNEIQLLKEENKMLKSKVSQIDTQQQQIQMLINEITRLKTNSSSTTYNSQVTTTSSGSSNSLMVKGDSNTWQNNANNIFYTNDSGAVSINTEDIYTLKPFSLEEILTYSNSPDKNTLAINSDCNYIFVGMPEKNYVQQYKLNKYTNLFEDDGTYDGPYGGQNGHGNFGFAIDECYPFLIVSDNSNSLVRIFDVSNNKQLLYDFSDNPTTTKYGYDVAIDSFDNVNYSFIASDIEYNNIYSAYGINSLINPNAPKWSNTATSENSGIGTGKSVDLKYFDKNTIYIVTGSPNYDYVDENSNIIKNVGIFNFNTFDISNLSSSNILRVDPPKIGADLYFGSNIKLLKNSNLIGVGGPGANEEQGNMYVYDVSFVTYTNSNGNIAGTNINVDYISDLSNESCVLPIIGSGVGNVMDFTYNPHENVYTLSTGIPNVGLLYNFSKNQSNDYVFNKEPIIFSADRTDISFGNSIAYQVNPNKKISILGIGAEAESRLYLYYNVDTIFNVYQNAFINGALEVEKSINCYNVVPRLGNESNGFKIGCWVVTDESVYPLQAFSYADFSESPYDQSVYKKDLGYYVYPTFKIVLYKGSDYEGNSCTIDNTDGTELVVYMMADGQNNQLYSMKVYQHNSELIDNPYLAQRISNNYTNANFQLEYN